MSAISKKPMASGRPASAMPADALPEGAWWGGFRVDDDEVWERIKSGELRMFSIQGRAEREAMA